MQLSMNFLIPVHPATPLERLDPERHAELIQALARIITKAVGPTEPPTNKEITTATPTGRNRHD